MEGTGTYVYKDGSNYEGEFHNNKKQGNGILTLKFKDGVERYTGFFREDLMDAFGEYTFKDGIVYKGDF
jgi:hypothetical protein